MRQRILHIIPDLGVGGAEKMLTQLVTAPEMMRRHESIVVTLLPRGIHIERLRAAGVTVATLDCGTAMGAAVSLFRLARLIRKLKPSVVQGWMYYGDLAALLARALSRWHRRSSLIWTIRCSDMDLTRYGVRLRLAVAICSRLSRWPEIAIANSQAGMKVHIGLGYQPRRFEVIENGIDVDSFRPDPNKRVEVRKMLGLAPDATIAIHVGRLDPMKDHQAFLTAMAELPNVQAVMVGAGTETLPDVPNVRRLGHRFDLSQLYAACDIVVSSSAFGEGFSNAVAEGMACGLPAVATDVGDAATIVDDTGLIVPPRDPRALAAGIPTLASESSTQRAERSARARARIVENYPESRSSERFVQLYDSMQPTPTS